jgi:hypothetical protein
MPVLVSADIPGQTAEGYDAITNVLGDVVKKAPGFIATFSHPIDGGWRVIEIWETSKDASEWFATNVHPNLPPGIKPQRHVQELHNLILP